MNTNLTDTGRNNMLKLTKRQEKAFTKYLFAQYLIEEGSGRAVYTFRGHLVIKVARNRNGIIQNRNEVIRFKKYGSEKLCVIVAYSKRLVIMERVNEHAEIPEEKRNEIAGWLNTICECDSEDHWESLGTRENGDVVCYDYGDDNALYKRMLNKDMAIRDYIAVEGEKCCGL